MKLIIEVEKDYYEMIKYNVEHGQEYKPFEIIANGIPYDDKERGKGMTGYNELRDGQEFYENGYKQGYADAETKFKRPQGEWGKWIITEIQCPTCFGYFETDCYSKEELKKCPNCGADMRKGGAE